jgi:peroxiredoxin
VWHRAGLDAWNISRPALFVVDGSGVIRAVFVGESQEEFPGSDEIEAALSPALQSRSREVREAAKE